MKILVCGGRDYNDRDTVFYALDACHRRRGITLIIEGGATGADTLARDWAIERGIEFRTFHVTLEEWRTIGKSAGPLRNSRMLTEGQPDGIIAFPGGRGTANMIAQAKAAGVKVWEVGRKMEKP